MYNVWSRSRLSNEGTFWRYGRSKEAAFWGYLAARYEVVGIFGVRQSNSVGGGSDAAFCCQYCVYLFWYVPKLAISCRASCIGSRWVAI